MFELLSLAGLLDEHPRQEVPARVREPYEGDRAQPEEREAAPADPTQTPRKGRRAHP